MGLIHILLSKVFTSLQDELMFRASFMSYLSVSLFLLSFSLLRICFKDFEGFDKVSQLGSFKELLSEKLKVRRSLFLVLVIEGMIFLGI